MPLYHRLTGALLGAVFLAASHLALAASGGGVAVNTGHLDLPPGMTPQPAPKHSHHKHAHTQPAATASSAAAGK